MAEALRRDWTLPEFLAWEDGQERRYELVDGRPVLMAGGTQAHALIAAGLLALLRPALRGTPCRAVGSDLRVPAPQTGNSRYPDVTIDCGEYRAESRDATGPAVLFEILSRSTRWYDQTRKVEDYESLPSVRHYVCVSQDEMRVSIWLRDGSGRLVKQPDLVEPDDVVLLEHPSVVLRLGDIYEGTGVPAPRAADA
jgi:Uma2 family endonuclease